jgi:hypothetical protein
MVRKWGSSEGHRTTVVRAASSSRKSTRRSRRLPPYRLAMSQKEPPPISTVTRQRARSGVGYAEDVVLHETKTSERRIVLRPWYIPHNTQPHGLAGKLIVQRRNTFGMWKRGSDGSCSRPARRPVRPR